MTIDLHRNRVRAKIARRFTAWRQLVLADGKGRYRLNCDLLMPERRRVRFRAA